MQENDHSDDDDDDDDKFDRSGILYMCSLNRVSTLHNHQHHLIYFIVPTSSHLCHRTNIISSMSSYQHHQHSELLRPASPSCFYPLSLYSISYISSLLLLTIHSVTVSRYNSYIIVFVSICIQIHVYMTNRL